MRQFSAISNINKQKWAISIIIFLFLAISAFTLTIDFNGFNQFSYLYYPQILTILLGASSLGIATYLLQDLTKNQLADVSILGIGNVNLLVAIILTINFNVSDLMQAKEFLNNNSWTFMIFSCLVVFALYFLSKQNKVISPKKIVIIGIILNFCLIAIYYSTVNFVSANKKDYIDIYFNGGILALSNKQYIFGYITLFIALVWMYCIKNKIFILNSNLSIAKTVGINPNSVYFQILFIVGILTGVAFFSLGNVVLLGLLGACMSKFLFKRNYNYAFIGSGLLTSLFLLIAFYFVTLISEFFPKVTGLEIYFFPIIGIPYFIYLALKDIKRY